MVDLSKLDIHTLRTGMPQIYQTFLDAKIRIIEFELINQPPSNLVLIDRLKKEIFARYNTGITPLRRAEVDNAKYDSDQVSKYFKRMLKDSVSARTTVSNLFLRQVASKESQEIESIMQFIRKSLVLYKFPIKYYAGGKARTELVTKFYEYVYENQDDPAQVYRNFTSKIDVIEHIRGKIEIDLSRPVPNRLFWECVLWLINVMEEEGRDYTELQSDSAIHLLKDLFTNNFASFELTDSHYYRETMNRFSLFASYLEANFDISCTPYVEGNAQSRETIEDVRAIENDSKIEIGKLETLRITKPDPSRNSIEDIQRSMNRNRFLVRPSYQRSEVIDLSKASAIIESILLGIMLPAIFIYKRSDGLSEVIDGQQRLLTILGFMEQQYLDENGHFVYSKNNGFKLRGLRILQHLNGHRFVDLPVELQDKIWDFELLVVEIEEKLNPHFNPVDLFIRLNDKPFPIREHSFEMWNSWVDKEIIDALKALFQANKEWFYIKNVFREKFRDRMQNEELLTILSYFDYRKHEGKTAASYLDIYQRGDRINVRLKKKGDITSLLTEVTEQTTSKARFLESIDRIASFLDKLAILLNCERSSKECLQAKLDALLSSGSHRKYYQRTLQDFYILWRIVDELRMEFLIQEDSYRKVEHIFDYMKNIPEDKIDNNRGYLSFIARLDHLISASPVVGSS